MKKLTVTFRISKTDVIPRRLIGGKKCVTEKVIQLRYIKLCRLYFVTHTRAHIYIYIYIYIYMYVYYTSE